VTGSESEEAQGEAQSEPSTPQAPEEHPPAAEEPPPAAEEHPPAAEEPAPATQEPPPPAEEPPPAAERAAPTAAAPPRRLMRSRDDRVIAGVCGGLGEYLGVDAVLIRIAALILVFAGGAGIILYLIGWIAMPEAPESPVPPGAEGAARPAPAHPTSGAFAVGLLFVLIGAFFLLDEVFPDFLSWHYIWPIALIAVGVAVLLRARQ